MFTDNSPEEPIRDLTYAGGMPDPQSKADSTMPTVEHPLVPQIRKALHRVNDPEIHRPITDLGMVDGIEVDAAGRVGFGFC